MPLCSLAVVAGAIGMIAVVKRLAFHRRFAGHGPWALSPCGGGPGFARGGCRGEDGDHGHRRGRWGFARGPGRSFWLRALFAHLDTTPGQEREIRAAIEDAQGAARAAKDGVKTARADVARAIGGETFDDAAVAEASTRVDEATSQVREAVVAALKRIHAILDEKQRARLADILSKERPFAGPWGTPYRG